MPMTLQSTWGDELACSLVTVSDDVVDSYARETPVALPNDEQPMEISATFDPAAALSSIVVSTIVPKATANSSVDDR